MSYNAEALDAYLRDGGNAATFEKIALDLFQFQYFNNTIYRSFCDLVHTDVAAVAAIDKIPFLPISFFKTHRVVSGAMDAPALMFESSGTTGEQTSRHLVKDAGIYRRSLLQGFRAFYGDPADYIILALLPSYLERQHASLVHMARVLMEEGGHAESGFYLDEWAQLGTVLQATRQRGQQVLLLGVTFALLDFAAAMPQQLEHVTIMETGGMKGRRAEWTRAQVHAYLKEQFGVAAVHSEYGMTELLSQAYALQDGIFRPAPTMRVLVRDINDPLTTIHSGSGCLNIIDLANVYSCSFIATEDLGRIAADGSFEVLGRMDHAALRGCSLMTA